MRKGIALYEEAQQIWKEKFVPLLQQWGLKVKQQHRHWEIYYRKRPIATFELQAYNSNVMVIWSFRGLPSFTTKKQVSSKTSLLYEFSVFLCQLVVVWITGMSKRVFPKVKLFVIILTRFPKVWAIMSRPNPGLQLKFIPRRKSYIWRAKEFWTDRFLLSRRYDLNVSPKDSLRQILTDLKESFILEEIL